MPGVKDERSHLVWGGFSCFGGTPIGKAPGVGTGDGGGVLVGRLAVLPLGRRVIIRERGSQPGTVDGDCWYIRLRRLLRF